MSQSVLTVSKRMGRGTSSARRLRREGKVPAVFYSESKEPTALEIDSRSFDVMLREGHQIINLNVDGKEEQVIIREIQRHPVNSSVLHVDFLGIRKDHKVTMTIPVQYEGKPKGVKEGGRLFTSRYEVTISVLPKDVPDKIIVNVDDLGLNEAIRVKDLKIENYQILDDAEELLCRVEIPKAVEEPVAAVVEPGAEEEKAEPEVITAREKEETESE